MKLKFLKDVELDVYDSPDDNAKPKSVTFKKGEITEVDLFDDEEPPESTSLQFGDGDVTFVNREFWTDGVVKILERD